MGGVAISANLKKESAQINHNGDEVIPFTKIVKKKKETEYIPTPEEIARATGKQSQPVDPPEGPKQDTPKESVMQPIQTSDPMSIQSQIEAVKADLAKLEELKKLKIAEMKKQLEILEQ